MRKTIFIIILLLTGTDATQAQQNLTLWYNKAARDWNEALPLGNGRLGAMIFGRSDTELIQLNEQTLWTGGPVNTNPNPDAVKYLQSFQVLLLTSGEYFGMKREVLLVR